MEARNQILTAEDIRKKVRVQYQYSASLGVVKAVLKELGYNWKLLRGIQSYVNTPENLDLR